MWKHLGRFLFAGAITFTVATLGVGIAGIAATQAFGPSAGAFVHAACHYSTPCGTAFVIGIFAWSLASAYGRSPIKSFRRLLASRKP